MEYKTVQAEVKSIDEKGEGVLRFIRFEQEDKDGDITRPGFIGRQKAHLLPAHNWKSDHPPLGRGESFEAEGSTNFRFRLNLNTPLGKEWRDHLMFDREHGALQQVSYGFSPHVDGVERWQKEGRTGRYLKPLKDGSPGAKLHEVSFVIVGSGNDTGVLSIKEQPSLTPSSEGEDPMEESRSMQTEDAVVLPQEAPTTDPEDWKNYSDEKRPPLTIMTKWFRDTIYHLKFIRDIRKRDGKEVSQETCEEFKAVIEEGLELVQLMNIKIMTSKLLPNVEEEELQRQQYNRRMKELSADAEAEEEKKLQSLQLAALELEQKSRARAAAMRQMFPAS